MITLAASISQGQAPSDLARQHLESGIQFYEQQRYNQALNDFQIIVTSMATSEYADDALLRIGRYYLDVEEDFAKAKDNLDSILKSYPTSDSAPGAYYYLGEVTYHSDRTGKTLDDALANYQRVFLYPDNPWIPAALYSTGTALERQGKFQEAVDAYFQVIVDHPRSEWTAGARLGVGRSFVRQGDPVEAMTQFQEARNTHPESSRSCSGSMGRACWDKTSPSAAIPDSTPFSKRSSRTWWPFGPQRAASTSSSATRNGS